GAARGGDAADRVAPVLGLDAFQLARGVADGFVPAHFLPGVGDLGADHGFHDPIGVSRVADCESALHARLPVVRMPVLVRYHAHDFLALHLGPERAADAAIRARRDDAVLGLPFLDETLLAEGCRRARLDAGAARDALRIHECLVLAGG